MKIYIYKGGLSIVKKSGVGSAVQHQEQMLKETGAPIATSWKEADVVHINTVFPDSVLAAWAARKQGNKVVYYGHSTMEDFRNSFIGSNLAAPLFRRWICRCYRMGDVILTPTEYSRKLLKGYGLTAPIYSLTNGVDTKFFCADESAGKRFRKRYRIPEEKKVVISAGHLIRRKGIFDFLELASKMPDILFIWFGGGNRLLIPPDVRRAVKAKTQNVIFAGFVGAQELKEAYCGADAFVHFSYEETEGIVVLEALACKVPVIVRRIPVYDGWLQEEVHVQKASETEEFQCCIRELVSRDCRKLTERGRKLVEEHSIYNTGMQLNVIYQSEKLALSPHISKENLENEKGLSYD